MRLHPDQICFSFIDSQTVQDETVKECESIVNGKTLADYAFLYTCTEKGNNSDIHFMMPIEDAMKWCSSNLSKGSMMGVKWAYFFTSVKNFVGCYWNLAENSIIDLRKHQDNGKWDDKIMSLGLKKFNYDEMANILKPFGITVLYKH